MKAKLTKSFVDNLEPDPDPKKRLTVWDMELAGFGVTVTPHGTRGGGVKSYIVQYRVGGRGTKMRRVTIGRHGAEWLPQAAREHARGILQMRRQGIDPFAERKRNQATEAAELAKSALQAEQARRFQFDTFCEEFIEDYAKKNQPRSWDLTQRALLDVGAHLKKQVGKVRVDTLERDQIEKALIRETVTRRCANLRTSPRSLAFFDKPVREAMAERINAASALSQHTGAIVDRILGRGAA